jgi:hypothetical protein
MSVIKKRDLIFVVTLTTTTTISFLRCAEFNILCYHIFFTYILVYNLKKIASGLATTVFCRQHQGNKNLLHIVSMTTTKQTNQLTKQPLKERDRTNSKNTVYINSTLENEQCVISGFRCGVNDNRSVPYSKVKQSSQLDP